MIRDGTGIRTVLGDVAVHAGGMAVSPALFLPAQRLVPVGTADAAWTGIGAAGAGAPELPRARRREGRGHSAERAPVDRDFLELSKELLLVTPGSMIRPGGPNE